jgi:hypothetical protein
MTALLSLLLWLVPIQDLTSPRHDIGDALTRRLESDAQFQVVQAVVVPLAVLVMNTLIGEQRAPEVFGHHPAVLKYETTGAAHDVEHRLKPGLDRWQSKLHVSAAAHSTAPALASGAAHVDGNVWSTFYTTSGELLTLHPTAKRRHRVPFLDSAREASDSQTRNLFAVHPSDSWRFRADRWMSWQRSQINRTRHIAIVTHSALGGAL